jgi:ubiquinone/menaquinone biosynthesis C-methylase UbiE
MLKIARRKVPKVKFKMMDMRDLKYQAKTFDGILAAYSLIHIPKNEILKTLKSFNKILKENGYMLVIVQKGESDKIVEEPLKKGEKMFINFFTLKSIANHLKSAGFKIVYQKEVEGNDPNSLSDRFIYTFARKV